MFILNDFSTSVRRALEEICPDYKSLAGLVICGTHNQQNVDEMIDAIRNARRAKIPTLLICAGHQLGAIQWVRDNGIPDATSEEFGEGTFVVKKRKEPKIGLHDGESWWSYFEVDKDIEERYMETLPDFFFSVAFHPEYQSSKFAPHPILEQFIKLCK